MGILWNGSIIPWLDSNGAPYSGAQAFFFDAGTTTPRTTYQDGVLGEPHDHPVLANAAGRFPAIFLSSGDFRLRIEDKNGVTISDTDAISTPSTGESGGGGGGDTPIELLFRTGDIKDRFATGSHSGWVRANGRTIGNASSGAAERANADCEALFLHLWTQDATLTVSGGRGANAASDWAASKQIALPDMRLRARIGMAGMGNSNSTLIADNTFDNYPTEGGNDLGATVGAGTVALTTGQLPAHSHSGTAITNGAHSHAVTEPGLGAFPGGGGFSAYVAAAPGTTTTAGAHDHTLSINNTGNGEAHRNVQPSAVVTVYIKL